MRAPDFTSAHWRKSTRSNGGGACVEVTRVADTVGIRDSKLGQDSAVITLEPRCWYDFIDYFKNCQPK